MSRFAIIVFLMGVMFLSGSRALAQTPLAPQARFDFYLLIDNNVYHPDLGYFQTMDGVPDYTNLEHLGQYGEHDVYRARNITGWVGDLINSYDPGFYYRGFVGFSDPLPEEGIYGEYAYPLSNNVLGDIDIPYSKIIEDVPYTDCTQQGPNGQLITYRARRIIAMPAPFALSSPAANRTICANEHLDHYSIGKNVLAESNRFLTFTSEWEYQVNGGQWKWLKSSEPIRNQEGGIDALYLIPEQDIPEVKDATQMLRFKYRYKAVYNSGATYYSPYSQQSDPVYVMPSAPTTTIADIKKTPSCAGGQNNGSVTIAGSAIKGGFAEMRWLLRKGDVATPCDPSAPANSPNACGNLDKASSGKVPVANGISIQGLASGDYTLWILNPGQDAGNCYSPYPVYIPELPVLAVTENTAQHANVSCYNANDGAISVTAAGADTTATYLFTLLSGGTTVQPETAGTGRSITWRNLPAGTYKAQVRNTACSSTPAFTTDIVITQPAHLTGTLVATSPLCVSPGDGNISVAAIGTASAYQFKLYSNGNLVKESGVITSKNHTFTDLPGGTYRAEIVNNDGPLCPKWDTTVTLTTLIPLNVSLASRDSVSCFGGNDGVLRLSAEGGSGTYTYTLTGNNQPETTNSTGVFTGLLAGAYSITLKNQGTACDDESILNTSVLQRAALNVQLQQTPLSCYPNTDAVIKAVVTGGSGSYSYEWQQLKNGVWTSNNGWLSFDTQIDYLSAGTYRVIITDVKASACTVVSDESVVKAVAEMQITNVTVHDAVCLADGAHIAITAAGGSGTYVYEWSLDGNTYHPFTAITNLTTAGNYRLRVSDDHGCMIAATGTYAVTLPTAPLSFTRVLSNYNGYNVSCKGNDNGYAQITATGGNGGSYSGYTYALDNGAYGPASLIEHITGGIHELHVKDGRGCISTQQISMTEPASTLGLQVIEKEHPGCGADPIGHITVAPDGGTSPYTYAVDNGTWQSTPQFTGLIAGDYTLKVKDAGGCVTEINTTLTAAYAPISTTADITDAKCLGASNGAIQLHVTGGDGNYTYQWSTPSLSGNGANNIPAGDYTINISDSKGCKQEVTFTVNQPEKLELDLVASNICDGAADGSINATVNGGTTPYKYSLDHSSWLNAGTFNGLSEGTYHMAVRDANDCEVNGDVTISKSNIKPEVNFLVASRRNAFDTLVIKDISLPEPDNITWAYDPAATFLGYDNGTPLIKFTDPGTYWVEMKATFGACTYSLRKELEIGAYDPHAGPAYTVPVQVIDTVLLSPNPNNGNFNFKIKLNRKEKIVVYVYDMNGIMAGKKQYEPTMVVDDSFSVGGTITGTFILRVITESDSRDVRFIISR